jgi:hypothetical protein
MKLPIVDRRGLSRVTRRQFIKTLTAFPIALWITLHNLSETNVARSAYGRGRYGNVLYYGKVK